jgi:hypothetical protein
MSLVICSNQFQANERTSNNNQAYTFKNNLSSQMKIAPNSEVAVQSVKINKDGTITIKPSDIFYIYQGGLVGTGKTFTSMDLSNGHTVRARINNTNNIEYVSIDEFRRRLQATLNRSIFNLAFSKLSTVEIKRDVDNVFQGFNFKFTQKSSLDTANTIPSDSSAVTTFNGFNSYWGYTAGAFTSSGLTTVNQEKRCAILTQLPLGNVGGKFKVTFYNASTTGTSWAVGLRRSRYNNDGKTGIHPEYFDPNGDPFLANGQFYDYVVGAFQNAKGSNRFLRVYQSCLKDGVTHGDDAMAENQPITMREIEYYGAHNADFASVYDMSTNFGAGESYEFVQFELLGDQMNLVIGGSEVSTANLVNPTTLVGSTKENVFKPMSLTTQLLYPQLWLEKQNKQMNVTTFNGRTGYTFANPDTDWWAKMESKGLTERLCKEVDTRYWANLGDASLYTYVKPNGSGAFAETDYPPVIIVSPDTVDYIKTDDANSEQLLGFDGRDVIEKGTYAAPTYTITNNSLPQLQSRGSAFIRLNNFTQQSFNAGKGGLSKILYHIPRFDNSGNQTGSDLFFEPAEKTYVALNNPNELNINSFDIDIVTENEVFAEDLVGKTIVVLHFRKQSHKM